MFSKPTGQTNKGKWELCGYIINNNNVVRDWASRRECGKNLKGSSISVKLHSNIGWRWVNQVVERGMIISKRNEIKKEMGVGKWYKMAFSEKIEMLKRICKKNCLGLSLFEKGTIRKLTTDGECGNMMYNDNDGILWVFTNGKTEIEEIKVDIDKDNNEFETNLNNEIGRGWLAEMWEQGGRLIRANVRSNAKKKKNNKNEELR